MVHRISLANHSTELEIRSVCEQLYAAQVWFGVTPTETNVYFKNRDGLWNSIAEYLSSSESENEF